MKERWEYSYEKQLSVIFVYVLTKHVVCALGWLLLFKQNRLPAFFPNRNGLRFSKNLPELSETILQQYNLSYTFAYCVYVSVFIYVFIYSYISYLYIYIITDIWINNKHVKCIYIHGIAMSPVQPTAALHVPLVRHNLLLTLPVFLHRHHLRLQWCEGSGGRWGRGRRRRRGIKGHEIAIDVVVIWWITAVACCCSGTIVSSLIVSSLFIKELN